MSVFPKPADRVPCAEGGPPPDADLVAAALALDGDAFGLLFRRYARLVHRVAAGILRDGGEAEDVTQDVFLEIYRRAHLYDPARGSVRVWLMQYAYHRSLRRKDALRRRAAYAAEPIDSVDGSARGRPPLLTREECRWIIRAGLQHLPAAQRTTLEMVCLEGLTLRDAASRLRVSLGCARHYYYRGLARLRAWALVAASSSLPPGKTATRGLTQAARGRHSGDRSSTASRLSRR